MSTIVPGGHGPQTHEKQICPHKKVKVVTTRHASVPQNILKCVYGRSSAPDPAGKKYSAPPYPSWIRRSSTGRKMGREMKERGRASEEESEGKIKRSGKDWPPTGSAIGPCGRKPVFRQCSK